MEIDGMNTTGIIESQGEGMAVRDSRQGKGRFDLVSPFFEERLAIWVEKGAIKYEERNWEKGIKYSRCLDSAKRHINKYIQGDKTEDNLAAACWNLMAIMHFEKVKPELNDLPKY